MSLIFKNIFYFWKSHLLVALSLALACAIIIASFVAGDSLRKSLEDKALNRLGKIETYVEKLGGFADINIANESFAKVLSLDAIASANGFSKSVKLYVVDDNFWDFSISGKAQKILDSIFVNETLAKSFNLEKGAQLALRLALREEASAEIPLSDSSPKIESADFEVSEILGAKDFGDFYLYDWQNSPANVFISYKAFNETFSLKNRANLFLSKQENSLKNLSLNFESLGLYLDENSSKKILKSKDVFIEESIAKSISNLGNTQRTLSWFISKIDFENGQDFNAFIVGAADDLASDEVEINEIYAKNHSLKLGDSLKLSYYLFDENLRLSLSEIDLKIAKISPINEGYFIREIVPDYDGLTNVDDCTKWKSSIPIDLKKISDLDKNYWENYGATPKLRISYELSKTLFTNAKEKPSALLVEGDLSLVDFSKVNLQALGFIEKNPSQDSLENAQNGVDFKELFLGLSFFVIFNAFLLIYLALKMNLSARQRELHLFKYLGFKKLAIENIYLKEFSLSIIAGGFLGIVLGIISSKFLLYLLNSIWGNISDGAEIAFNLETYSLLISLAISLSVGFVLVKVFSKKIFRLNEKKEQKDAPNSPLYLGFLCLCFFSILAFGIFAKIAIIYKLLISLFSYFLGAYFSVLFFRYMANSNRDFGENAFILKRISKGLSKSVYLILSMGVYLLCVVGLNKIDSAKEISDYSYVVNTVLGTNLPEQNDFDMLALRKKEAALANCLNLNKVNQAQVLGANIDALIGAKVIAVKEQIFEPLDGAIAVYVDESSMIWSLKASLGDSFEYDTQIGKVKLKIMGTLKPSIFQGSFIMKEEDFKNLWGAKQAYNIFLAKPKNELKSDAKSMELSKLFSPYLPDVNTAKSILEGFDSLQNSYLKIFYQLGILALALGVFASLVHIRNKLLLERKYLYMLNLLGFRASLISRLVASEYLLLNFSASALGLLASLPLINIVDNYLKALLILLVVIIFNCFLYPLVKGLISSKDRSL